MVSVSCVHAAPVPSQQKCSARACELLSGWAEGNLTPELAHLSVHRNVLLVIYKQIHKNVVMQTH